MILARHTPSESCRIAKRLLSTYCSSRNCRLASNQATARLISLHSFSCDGSSLIDSMSATRDERESTERDDVAFCIGAPTCPGDISGRSTRSRIEGCARTRPALTSFQTTTLFYFVKRRRRTRPLGVFRYRVPSSFRSFSNFSFPLQISDASSYDLSASSRCTFLFTGSASAQ